MGVSRRASGRRILPGLTSHSSWQTRPCTLCSQVVGPAASGLLALGRALELAPLAVPAIELLAAARRRVEAASERAERKKGTPESTKTATSSERSGEAFPRDTPTAATVRAVTSEAVTVAAQLLPIGDQIEPLLREVDSGSVEFEPSPDEVRPPLDDGLLVHGTG